VKPAHLQAGLILCLLLLAVILTLPAGRSAQLIFAGDLMLGRGVAEAHEEGDWDEALALLVPELAGADLTFANLESPLTDAPLVGAAYDLRASPDVSIVLSQAGVDLVSLVNNHILDAGPQGLEDTLQTLESAGILALGPQATSRITRVNGLILAWYGFDDTRQRIDAQQAQNMLAAGRHQADLQIVSIHWGSEGETAPSERQRQLAHAFASAGADLIVGHHPHVLQPVEWIWGDGRGRPTLVAYSLGNALFDQGAPPAARYGALLLVSITSLGVRDACALPFQIDPSSWNTIRAEPEVAQKILGLLRLDSCGESPSKQ
jgi:poly-gamma-glutamate capsule biosynthesis protein CapA/YwtB (metallophosphatase superfamily)